MEFLTVISIATAALYGLTAYLMLTRFQQTTRQMRSWLLLTTVVAALTSLSFILPEDSIQLEHLTRSGLTVFGVSLTIALITGLTPVYLQWGYEKLWLAASLLWWIGTVVLTLTTTDQPALLGQSDWFAETFNPTYLPGVVTLVGWIVLSAAALLITFFVLYRASLPEVANRAIFWVITLPIALMGLVLAGSGSSGLTELGLVIELVGILGLIYATTQLRVMDVRRRMIEGFSAVLMGLLASITIFIALVISKQIEMDTDAERLAFFAGLAFAAGLIYTVIRIGLTIMINRMAGRAQENMVTQLYDFAEVLTAVVELDELLKVIIDKMRDILRVQRGGLILFTERDRENKDDTIRFNLKPSQPGPMPTIEGTLALSSPILRRLLLDRRPLSQFEIDYDPAFQTASEVEKNFFKQLRMSAYAPVLPQGETLGLLCAGPKISDEPFSAQDLDLLATLANQAGVALRNARLVADLRHREQETKEANEALQNAKKQLEQLDAVKTDFITIASHELRTPLAQIRGYNDIIEALNEQGMLDPDQLGSMTSNLRKATDRMEELIRNMLDVSQLDVNAMDLRFSNTTIENVVRMALEPLTESIRSRKQSLTARGLRGLPEIEADMQRMVQALQNVVLNAVKFTPDGGRIDISGSLTKNPKTGRDEILLEVHDTGIGIDTKNQEIIFEKFVRAHDPSLHSTGKTKFMGAGPGLGLTIARGVIEGHGGRISVESTGYDAEKLPGSTFKIILPVKPPEEASGVLHFEPTILAVDRAQLLKDIEAAASSAAPASTPPKPA